MGAINYAVEYSKSLSNALPHVLHFGALYGTPNNGRYKWTNAKTIEIPSISTSGRKSGSRDSIQTPGRNWDNAWEPKVLSNERYWDTLIHPVDVDQTNMVATIGNITKVYNETQKFPEMDAYTVSKILSDWTTAGGVEDNTILTTDNVLTQFDAMMKNMDNALVSPNGRILYVTPTVNDLIKNAKAVERQINLNGNTGALKRTIVSLDLVTIEVVPDVLMKTVYDFTSGWAAGVGARQINMLLIHPLAVITPTSYSFASLDAPSALTSGKYYYYEESFEDVFILNNWKAAIAVNVDAVNAG